MQPLSPCTSVITGPLGFGIYGSPRSKLKPAKSPLTQSISQQKPSGIVQTFLSSVMQLATTNNNDLSTDSMTVVYLPQNDTIRQRRLKKSKDLNFYKLIDESPNQDQITLSSGQLGFKKRDVSQVTPVEQSNQKSLLSEMLKKQSIPQTQQRKPIILKIDLTSEVSKSVDTGNVNYSINNEMTIKKLKFGDCPLVVRKKPISESLKDNSLKSDSSKEMESGTKTSFPTLDKTNKIIRHFSPPLLNGIKYTDETGGDSDSDKSTDDGYIEDDEDDDDYYDYDNSDDENLSSDDECEELICDNDSSHHLTYCSQIGPNPIPRNMASASISTSRVGTIGKNTTSTSASTSPTSFRSTTSHYSTAISILTPTTAFTPLLKDRIPQNKPIISMQKSKSLPYTRNDISKVTIDHHYVNSQKKGIPIPPPTNSWGTKYIRSHHHGNRDKHYKQKHCRHHHGQRRFDKGDDVLKHGELGVVRDAEDVLFWPMSI